MKNLFKILEIKKDNNSNEFTIELSGKDHPIFKAHFPNNQILPGFIQIDIISNILEHKIKKIKKAKFLSIIKPNNKIKYFVSTKDEVEYKIILRNLENSKLSEFSYEI